MALFRSLFTGGDKSYTAKTEVYYEPSPRCYPYAAPVAMGERLFMWGGRIQDWSSESRRRLVSVVEMYDPYLELWEQHPTSGTPPVGLYAGACASLLDSLYSYGGDGFSYHGGLYHLNTTSMSWSEVEVCNASEGPMKKAGSRMVSYQDKLLLVGGYGIPTTDPQPGARFHRDTPGLFSDGRGWTNEVHLFHLQEGVWTSPATTGTRPPPCSDFSLTSIDPKRAVFFGGYQPEHGRVNDVYILDLEAMHWTKVDKSGGGPWPVGRAGHAACCINYGHEHPQLLVTGGRDNDDKVLGDAWLLDVDSATWKELALPADLPPREGHTATAFSLAPGLTEVAMFGGIIKWPSGATTVTLPKLAETTVFQLESIETPQSGGRPSTQEWVLVGVARRGQLGAAERLREKVAKMQERKFENIQPAQDGSMMREGGVQERPATANRRAEEAEQRARDSETRAQEAERNAQKAQARVCDLEQQVHDTTTRAQQAETRATGAERRATEAETRATGAETRATGAETRATGAETRATGAETRARATEAERRATEAEKQLQQEQQFWMVRRNEIEAEQRARDSETRAEEAEARVRDLEHQLHDSEREARYANQRAQEAKQRADTAQTEAEQRVHQLVRDTTTRAHQAEGRATEAERRATEAERRATETERRATEAERRATEAERRATGAERMATEAERRLQQEQQFWMVHRDEIELTDEILGEGGWGAVKVANFRGVRVAAKCLHRIIASPYNRQLFMRELTMAARVRHPNLLQFIGATLEGELILLTELMPTSLRAQLERGIPLPHHQIISISLDVARALNYLHLMRPSPIVHRDLSSANVLMEPKHENTWKAKVSDYGTINLLQKVRTVMPGSIVYAAPESNDPSQQSPKMDIFSFGVLLVETCTATFPDFPDRERLIQSIADRRMVDLIRECVSEDRDNRPPATEIIARLTEMQS